MLVCAHVCVPTVCTCIHMNNYHMLMMHTSVSTDFCLIWLTHTQCRTTSWCTQLADQNNRIAAISTSLIPDVDIAVALYEACGGYLNTPSGFGTDPVGGSPELLRSRQDLMEQNVPSPEDLAGLSMALPSHLLTHWSMIDTSIHLQRFFIEPFK